MAHDVFISYSSRDKEVADAVVTALEAAGMPCWIAPRDIHPGVEWSQAIVEAVRASRLLLLIFTAHSNESPQVLREVERAVSLRVPIIPFRIEDVALTPSMEYFISVAHWLTATAPPLEAHLPHLVAAAREQMAAPRPLVSGAAGGAAAAAGTAAPSAHTSVPHPVVLAGNLPSALTEIIGREEEVAEISRLLTTTRLLTLTGVGGCGKSRLAVESARNAAPGVYPDGAWLVELGSLREPDLVDDTVAAALRLPSPDRLAEDLREKRLLLVLDNCEHLLTPCAELAERLLKTCPDLRILATSREPFNSAAERVWRVPSLALPDPRRSGTADQVLRSPAVRFFAQRAQFRNPRFAVTDANAPVIAHICRRLDGIPLALELAAARARALPVEQIAQRLDDQFRLLAGGGERTALPQHQTLRALMDWSFHLLNEPEKALLRRLSVFGGGCTLEAAEAVCADGEDGSVSGEAIETWEVLDYLSQLVDKSLVGMEDPSDSDPYAPVRYRLMETVRAYAREKLKEAGEEEDWGRRHERHFRDLVLESEAALIGKEAGTAQARLLGDRDNLRLALDNLLAHAAAPATEPEAAREAAEDAARVALALNHFWARQGAYREACTYFRHCLAREDLLQDLTFRGSLYRLLGWFSYLQGDHAEAEVALERALALYRENSDASGEATTLNARALVAQAQGRLPEARASYGRCLQLARDSGEEVRAGDVLSNLGLLHIEEGSYAEARTCLEEARSLFGRLGDARRTGGALCNLSNLALKEGVWADARRWSEESLELFTSIGHRMGMVFSLINLTEAAASTEDHASALGYVRDALLLCQDADLMPQVPLLLELRAVSLEATYQNEESLLLLEFAAALRRSLPQPAAGAEDSGERDALAARLEASVPPERAAELRAQSARLKLEEIFAGLSNS